MADIELIKGADNGNQPDTLRQMYPKVNRNFDKLNKEIADHKNSTAAHAAQDITYSGDAPGANAKDAINNTYKRISQIVAQSGDDITELVDARGDYDVLADRLNASDAQLADIAINVKKFGSIQLGLEHVATNGGTLYLPEGRYDISDVISKTSGIIKPFTITGAGIGKTIIVRNSDFSGSMINIGNGENITVKDLTLVCNNSIYPNGNHGLVMFNGSSLRAKRIEIIDYKNSAILMYGENPNNSYENCVIEDCFADGKNAANNGFLVANLSYSGIRRCHVKELGKSGSPGYALQLKNQCKYSFIIDSYADGAITGLGFGNDDPTTFVEDSIVSNIRIRNCISGFAAGNAIGNNISNMIINMNNTGNHPIDLQSSCIGNSIKGISVKNLSTSKSAVRIRSGCTDNTVVIDTISNVSEQTGKTAEFNIGSARNSITLKRMSKPFTVTNSASLVTDYTSGSENVFEYELLPVSQSAVINSDAVMLSNSKVKRLRVDTEASAAADNLSTISGGYDGQIITVQQTSNVRDITIKHGTGNIRLNGGADVNLTTVNQTLTLIYDSIVSSWVEVSRGTAT